MSSEARKAAVTLQDRLNPTFGFTPEKVQLILAPYYQRGEQLIKIALLIHLVLAFALATLYQTWAVTLVVAPGAVALFFLGSALVPRTFVSRCLAALALQAFVLLHIYQMHGLSEMHFFYFTALALMIASYDARVIWLGAVLILIQHLVLAWLTAVGVPVHFFADDATNLLKLLFHFVIGGVMVVLCSYWTMQMRRQILRQRWQTQEIVRLAQIARNAGESIVLTDRGGCITWANDSFTRLTGYSLKEAAGQELLALLRGPSSDSKLIERMRTALTVGTPFNGEVFQHNKDGRACWVTRSITPMPASLGPEGGAVVIDRDDTERRRAEQERVALDRRLQEIQRLDSLGVLAGGVAHDFNNLLTAILGYSSLSMQSLPASSPIHGFLGEIQLASRRAADLCKQMLAFAGKGQLLNQPVDLNEICSETVELLRSSVPARIRLEWTPTPITLRVQGDPTQLQQVVMNLLVNAIEAIGEHTGCIKVQIRAIQAKRALLDTTYLGTDLDEGVYLLVEVSDSGSGMDKETLARIYDPFFTTKFPGRGLGLAAVLGIVRSHRGTLAVSSEVGFGTTFRVYFAAEPTPPASTPEPVPWRGTGLVLLVEDEDPVRNVALHLLNEIGFEVIHASNGPAAFALLAEHGTLLRLILLDLTMPQIPGEEVLAEVVRRFPRLPVIVMSGHNEAEMRRRLGSLQPAGLLNKPFAARELHQAVHTALASSAQLTQQDSRAPPPRVF